MNRRIIQGLVFVLLLMSGRSHADQAAVYYRQGVTYKRQGENEKAIQSFEAALAQRSDYAAAHLSLGMLYRQLRRYDKAIYHLETTVKLQPNSAEAYYSLGLAYFQAGRQPDAIKALDRAVKLKPDDDQIVSQLGILLIRTNPTQAIALLNKAVARKPQSQDYLHQLGLAYRRAASDAAEKKKTAEADQLYKQAEANLTRAAALGETAAIHFDLGALYRRLEEDNKAIFHYEKAVEQDPKLAAAWWDLGIVYAKNRRNEDAINAYKTYLALESNDPAAKIARDRVSELEQAAPKKKKSGR